RLLEQFSPKVEFAADKVEPFKPKVEAIIPNVEQSPEKVEPSAATKILSPQLYSASHKKRCVKSLSTFYTPSFN
ncbi:hypothetical protein ACTHOQ_04445, partial [Solibacillus silvestris]|uniref:hypothetical protein n=1 Tax=Solibacillus silvestris TaxID=76853 RepID=UPI003F7FFB14